MKQEQTMEDYAEDEDSFEEDEDSFEEEDLTIDDETEENTDDF